MFTLLRVLNQNVQFVDRRHNNLKDVPEDVLASFKTLEEVLLDSNHIRVLPKSLFRLSKIRKLSLSENEIIHLPFDIGNLSTLVELDVSKNDLLDIPDNIKCLKQLQIADFSSNPLKRISLSIVHLQNLTSLRLNDVDLTELPSDFGRLVNLQLLELRDNMLKDLPSSFVSLKKLNCLDLGNNMFEDMPPCLCQLTMLEELWLDSNEISALINDIKKLKKLKCFDVTENDLEFLPEEISGLESLTDLYASQNYLQLLPNGIGNLSELTVLKVDSNRLMSLPNSLGKCTKLQELVLKENEILSFPSSIGQLSSLTTLIADCNKLSSLPPELCNMTKLSLFSLRDNCLYYLPEDIGMMKDLQVLDVCGNRLQYLPSSIIFLNLKALWLSENQHQPLLKLQRDFDWKTKRDVITCYMLPQQEYTVHFTESLNGADDKEVFTRQRVEFEIDSEDELDKSGELVRHATPYPKDLKSKVIKLLPQKTKSNKIEEKEQLQPSVSPVPTDSGNTSASFSPVCGLTDQQKEPQIENPSSIIPCENLPMENEKAKSLQFMKKAKSDGKINERNEYEFSKIQCQENHHYEAVEVVNLYVQRAATGLGLSIAGGKESPPYKDNDEGVFVSKITTGGPSHKAGLKVDDKILKVNDVPMTDIDHYTAVQVLRNAGNSIRFTCMRKHKHSQITCIDKPIPSSTLNSNETSKFIENSSSHLKQDIPSSGAPTTLSTLNSRPSKNISMANYRVLPDAVVSHHCNTHLTNTTAIKNPEIILTNANGFHQSNHHVTSFEPDMTSTPVSLSRASSKEIPDVIQPATLSSLVHSASYDTSDRYEGPVVTVTIQNPRPYAPLLSDFPPPTKALGNATEVLTQSSYSETTTTRITNNKRSIKEPFLEQVVLTKQNGPLGLSIMGGFDQTCLPFGVRNPGIFVSRIAPNGTAAKTGKIRIGDRIVKVNNVDLTKATHNEAVAALCLPADQVTLLIQHDPLPCGWQEIVINKLPGEILGVEINGGLGGIRVNPFDFEDEGIFVTKIYPNSAAMRTGLLKVGMRVIEICHNSVLGATYEEANHEIMSASNTASFLVCDGFNNELLNASYSCPPESRSVTIDSVPGIDSDDESVEIFQPSNQDLVMARDKSVDERVLDVVHAAERLVTPAPRFFQSSPCSLRKERTTTIVLSQHTVHPLSVEEQECPEPTYLPCEV